MHVVGFPRLSTQSCFHGIAALWCVARPAPRRASTHDPCSQSPEGPGGPSQHPTVVPAERSAWAHLGSAEIAYLSPCSNVRMAESSASGHRHKLENIIRFARTSSNSSKNGWACSKAGTPSYIVSGGSKCKVASRCQEASKSTRGRAVTVTAELRYTHLGL